MYPQQKYIGRRVELCPHLDLWMKGSRFGIIVGEAKDGRALVRMDNNAVRELQKIHICDLQFIN